MNPEQFTKALTSDKVVANLQALYDQSTKIYPSTTLSANTSCTISSYSSQSIYVQDIDLLIPADVWITLRIMRMHRDPSLQPKIKVVEIVSIEFEHDP